MARPTGWDILGLDGDPTPGVVESVQALAKEFGDFAHDVEAAYRSLNSFGSDATALEWVGQTADAFKSHYGPLPGRLQKLYTSYSEASDALSAYAPQLQAAQSKADSALRQAQDANADLQRATTTANSAAADLKTAQQNHAANPDPKSVTDAQTAHDTAQTNLNNAKARMATLAAQANQAYDDRINAAKACAKALGHAQSDGIHNKSWWQHLGEDLSKWGGEIGKIAGELAPILDVIALATSWIPGVDVVTAALAEADNIIALAGTAMATVGDALQGHWGDALLGVGMLALATVGARGLGSEVEGEAGALEGEAGALEGEAGALEGDAGSLEDAAESESGAAADATEPSENSVGEDARTSDGDGPANTEDDPVDVVSGWMLTSATDLDLPGTLPLVLRRAYASGYRTGRLFGPGWSSTLDQRLSINESGIHFVGDDAQRLDYPMPAADEQVLPTRGTRWPLAWDREADEIRVIDPWTGRIRHFGVVHFSNEVGQIRDLTAITDRNGNRISILRDEQGTPTAVEHPGYTVAIDTITTAAGPRISGIRVLDASGADSGSVAKQFRYDDRGRLIGVINSSGLPFTYEWDDSDRITAWRDRTGYRYGYIYDHLGRVAHGEGAFLAGSFQYDPANRTTSYTNSLGHVTTFVYDEHGHVTSETDPLGHVTVTVSDPYGRLLSRTDALGGATEFEYDSAGDLRRVVAADGAVTSFDYNPSHCVLAATGPDGATWRRQYDDQGNAVAAIDPAGTVARFEYSDNGALTAMHDPTGAITSFSVDDAGLAVAWVDPMGGTTHVIRDAAGRVIQATDSLGAVTTYTWNADGRPGSRIDPDGAVTQWRHNPDGRLIAAIEPTGAATVFEPGPMNLLAARTGPDGVRLAFAYDSEMRLFEVTNSTGATWSYTYDAAGRLVGETDFIDRTLGYEYDQAGRLTARITGIGQRITLNYDTAGRIVERLTPEGEYAYSYDSVGRLASATGPDSRIEWQHDQLGQLISETVNGRTVRYAYNNAGQRAQRVTASGAESMWTFDGAGRPIGLAAGAGRLTMGYDASGQEIQRVIGGIAQLSCEYDAVGRLITQLLTTTGGNDAHLGTSPSGNPTTAGMRTLLSRSWTWRADSVPEEIRDSLHGARRIVSDPAGRVTAVNGHGWSESYAYDAFGNLNQGTGARTAADPESGTVATQTLIRRAGRTHHEYDAAGRLTSTVLHTLDGRRKTWNYTWDSQDRLVQAETPDSGTWRYSYDALGRRTGKYRIGDNGEPTEQILFTWDGPRLVEQHTLHPSGTSTTLTWDYDPSTFRPAAQRRRSWASEADQELIDDAFHAIVTDLVGAPTELVTSDGRIAWSTTATVWGRTIGTDSDPGLDCPLRFPGQYHDAETGLHYNLNRYYSPDIGAYLTPDPLGLAPSPNDHAYISNPLTVIDPLGLYGDEDGDDGSPAEKPVELKYEVNPKHKYKAYVNSRGQVVSRLPRGDAQEMLDNSVQTKARQRVGTEPGTGLDVVFKQHLVQEFDDKIVECWHGFVPED